jgi:hypothetical protein
MFIKNPSSIKQANIIKVNEQQKDILILHKYSPLSNSNGQWIFVVDEHILHILNLREGG